jgi:hypothetical protein
MVAGSVHGALYNGQTREEGSAMAQGEDEQSPDQGVEDLDAPPALKELAQKKLSMAFMVRRELKKLPDVLGADEEVLNLARGEYDGREGLMAVTDRRIVFLEQGMLRHRFEDFRYEKITSVQTSTGIRSGKLTIFSAGNKHEIKDVHPKQRAVEIGDFVRAKTSPDSGPATGPPITAAVDERADPMDQLRRLGELRDSGVITEEEFEAKKADLLGRL